LDRTSDESGAKLFELALCRECGQHFIVGKRVGDVLSEAILDSGDPEYGAEYYMPIDCNVDSPFDWIAEGSRMFLLDGLTGNLREIATYSTSLDESRLHLVLAPESETQALRATACPWCGYSGVDPLQTIRPGKDGPHVVIASTLHEQLPEGKRRVLAFADSRRDAARFAWFLEASYKAVLARTFLLKAARRLPPTETDAPTLEELVYGLVEIWRLGGVVPESKGTRALVRDAWLAVYREFVTQEKRLSLSGTGRIQWSVRIPGSLVPPEFLLRSPWNLPSGEALDLLKTLLNQAREDGAVELSSPLEAPVSWDELDMPGPQISFRIGEGNRRTRTGPHVVESWDSARGRRVHYLKKILAGQDEYSIRGSVEVCQDAVRKIWESLCDQSRGDDGLLIRLKDSRRLNPDWWRCIPASDLTPVFTCDTCGSVQVTSVAGICARHGCPGHLHRQTVGDLPANHYAQLYESDLPNTLRAEEHTAQIEEETARQYQKEFSRGDINVLSSSTTFELGVDLGDLDVVFLRNVPPAVFNYAQRAGRTGRRSARPGLVITFCGRSPHDLYHFADPEKRLLNGEIPPPVVQIGNARIARRHVTAVALSSYFRQQPDRFLSVQSLLEDVASPTLAPRLLDFLGSSRKAIEAELCEILPTHMWDELGLRSGDWIGQVCGATSRLSQAEAEISSDHRNLTAYMREAIEEGEFDRAKWARQRVETIEKSDVLSFLSRKAVIPKYGFPVDVVELDLSMSDASRRASTVHLERDLSIAISEFAPGARVMANKMEWEANGLKRPIGREWPVSIYRECRVHGTFESWHMEESPPTQPCCREAEEGKYIQPIYGFVGSEKGTVGRHGSGRVFSSRPHLVRVHDADVERDDLGVFTVTRAAPGTMVVLCKGVRGQPFYICGECGAAFDRRKHEHRTPLGRKCEGTLTACALGHEFVTDVVSFHFALGRPATGSDATWFAFSLAYSLLEGSASALGVPAGNLDVTVSHNVASDFPEIVLYDNVPGGAGLVAQLRKPDVLRRCLREARDRVDGRCGCGPDQSCYGCLRSYRNQFAHRFLARGPVLGFLNLVLGSLGNRE
jgi:hypothetical protein